MEIVFCVLGLLLILLGVIGNFAPILPAPVLAWCGFLLCFLGWTDGPIGWGALLMASALVLFAHAFEFVGSYFGAKWFGATWRGGVGALLGGIAGPLIFLLLPIPGGFLIGLFVGPVVGALAGELLGGRTWGDAGKAGFGTVVGNLSAMLLKLAVCLFLLVAYLGLVGWHCGRPWAQKWFSDAPPAAAETAPDDIS